MKSGKALGSYYLFYACLYIAGIYARQHHDLTTVPLLIGRAIGIATGNSNKQMVHVVHEGSRSKKVINSALIFRTFPASFRFILTLKKLVRLEPETFHSGVNHDDH